MMMNMTNSILFTNLNLIIIFMIFTIMHPINAMMMLILYCINSTILMFMNFNNSLMMMIMMISIISGMMIMFMYFTSLLNNEKSPISTKLIMKILITVITTSILMTMFSFPPLQQCYTNMNLPNLMNMMYTKPWIIFTLINIIILILILIFIIKSTLIKYKSIRKLCN